MRHLLRRISGTRRLMIRSSLMLVVARRGKGQPASGFRSWGGARGQPRNTAARTSVAAVQGYADERRGFTQCGPEHLLVLTFPADAVLPVTHQVQPVAADGFPMAEPDPGFRFE
jgi:hypothetical protein